MFRLLRGRKGQGTAEYAILIGIIIAVAIAMQTYIKRGMQGRFKAEVDDMAVQTSELGSTTQYEPYYLESEHTITTTKDYNKLSGTAKSPTRESEAEVTQSGEQKLIAPAN